MTYLFNLVIQRKNIGLQGFSKSCWAGLEKKFFWLTEQTNSLKKLKVFPYKSRQNSVHQAPAQSISDNQFGNCNDGEIEEDMFVIKTLLERLKLALVQVNSDVADENEMLKKELKSLKGMIQEKDMKIRMLENFLHKYEKSMYINSIDVIIK